MWADHAWTSLAASWWARRVPGVGKIRQGNHATFEKGQAISLQQLAERSGSCDT